MDVDELVTAFTAADDDSDFDVDQALGKVMDAWGKASANPAEMQRLSDSAETSEYVADVYELGEMHETRRDFEAAENCFRRAAAADHDDAALRVARVLQARAALGDAHPDQVDALLTEAEDWYEEAARAGVLRAWLLLGDLHRDQGHRWEAEHCYEKAQVSEPEEARARLTALRAQDQETAEGGLAGHDRTVVAGQAAAASGDNLEESASPDATENDWRFDSLLENLTGAGKTEQGLIQALPDTPSNGTPTREVTHQARIACQFFAPRILSLEPCGNGQPDTPGTLFGHIIFSTRSEASTPPIMQDRHFRWAQLAMGLVASLNSPGENRWARPPTPVEAEIYRHTLRVACRFAFEQAHDHPLTSRWRSDTSSPAAARPGATAADIMLPAAAVTSVSSQAPLTQALDAALQSRQRTLPVHDPGSEEITGVVHLDDLAGQLRRDHGHPSIQRVADLRQPGVRVPEDTPVADLTRQLAEHNTDLGLITAADGRVRGVVSLTDALSHNTHAPSDRPALAPAEPGTPTFLVRPSGLAVPC